MRRPPLKAKKDISQDEIVKALRLCGFSVYVMDMPCDLLVGFAKKAYLIECKTGKGKLTKAQTDFVEEWKGPFQILRTAEEAIEWAKKVKQNDVGSY